MSYDGNTWKLIKFNSLKSDIINNSNYKNKEISEAIPFVPLGHTYSIISFKDYFNDIIYNDRFIIICASCSCVKLINKGFIFKRKEPISFEEVILFIYNISTKQWNTVRIFDIFPFNRIKKIKKIIESGGDFYILTENKLLKSSNGVNWNEINIFNINIVRDIYNSKYGILISVSNNDYYMRYNNIHRLFHNNTDDIDYNIIPKEIIHNFSKFIYIKTSDTYIAFYDIKSSGCYHEQSLALSNNLKHWIKININSKNMSSNSHLPISLYTIKRIIFFNKTVFLLFDQDNENIYSIKLLNKPTYSINLNKN